MIAAPAMAQTVTGTVTITGSVAPKCFVDPGAGSTFGATVQLNELAKADGTLRTIGPLSATSGSLSTRIVCTTPAPQISVNAEPLLNAAAADPGYANRVDYQADVAVTRIVLGVDTTATFSNDSAAANGAVTPIGGRLSNVANNVVVSAQNFRTANATDLLVSGNYSGTITVVVTPT
jgi:hypothetical protein